MESLQIRDLRIGNWVKWNYEERSDGNAYPVEFGYELDDIKNNPNIVKPIPLTEEWLKRFNWNPPKDIGVSFSLTTDEIHFVAGNYYKKIEHVNQLQNLYFALTGEELELKL